MSGHTVYLIGWERTGPLKIGHAGDPLKRLAGLQSGNPRRLFIFGAWVLSGAVLASKVERAVHWRLEKRWISG